MIKGVKKFLTKQYYNTFRDLNKLQVNRIVKSDLMKLVMSERKNINEYTEYFLSNYLTILKTLQDHGIKQIKYSKRLKTYNITDMQSEITSMEGVYDHYVGGKVFNKKFTRGINIMPYQKATEKLNVLNHLLSIYPTLLTFYEMKIEHSNSDVDIDDIRENYEKAKYLNVKKDLEYIKKLRK